MGIFDSVVNKAFGQFIDVIEWVDATRATVTWKFPRGDNEIKNGAQPANAGGKPAGNGGHPLPHVHDFAPRAV